MEFLLPSRPFQIPTHMGGVGMPPRSNQASEILVQRGPEILAPTTGAQVKHLRVDIPILNLSRELNFE